TFNNTTTGDGTPILDGFTLTFDRRVKATTLSPANVRVLYHDTVAGSAFQTVTVFRVRPLDLDSLGGATTFFVQFDVPQSRVGTYSYAILPGFTDLMGNGSDQNANGVRAEAFDRYEVPTPLNPPTGPYVQPVGPFKIDSQPLIIA